MNYKAYPDSYWQKIEDCLKQLKNSKQPLVAAFDADGTLWDTDLGENFFQYQIEHNELNLPADPWNHYLDLKKINDDPRPAYLWLAQINHHQTIDQVKSWATDAFAAIQPNPIFAEQHKLIQLLRANDVSVYIVTASIKWAVEPGARALGLTDDCVIGVETQIVNGLVTDKPVYPVTYRAGKVEALLKKTNQQQPFLSSGNTMGDFELLEAATHLRLAVSAASRDDRLFRTESELLQKAADLNWLGHRFI